MSWNLEEAIDYYRNHGAPQDQNALIGLLKEIQKENGGSIPIEVLTTVSDSYRMKESLLLALIKRLPSLRLDNTHCLELCSGRNCGKHTALAAYAEKLKQSGGSFTLKYIPCMRMCGKGPNIRWDGKVYHQATEELIRKLVGEG